MTYADPFCRWTILLLLVLVRTLLAIASLDDNLGQAKRQALSACSTVENVGSTLASMPHYMAQGTNELTAQGIERAINGLMQMLIMTITGVEEIIVFIINLLTQTYICLITFAVTGSLHAAISIAEDVGGFLNSTAKGVSQDLDNAASDFENAMNSFLSDLGSLLTSGNPPKIDLTSEITTLNNLQLPSGYDSDLQKLNASIPTFAEVHNFTIHAIEWPFEQVKQLLNESLPKYTMDRSLFPVPAKESLTFCSDNNGITNFFEGLIELEQTAKKVFLAVIITLAILAMIPMAWREMRKWELEQERARLIRSDALDPMDAVYIASRPYTSTAGLKLAEKLHPSQRRRRTLVRWAVAYATTTPALFVLALGIAGLLGCLCQYILLKIVEKEVPILENQVIGFADKVINSLNNASEQWAIGTNHIITNTSEMINNDVFGWVNTSTTAVNNTLNVFVDGVMNAINVTFGGTILYEPVLDVLDCLVLLKVQGIEHGLTWVQDHAHIDFPLLPPNTFSLGAIQKVGGSEADILAAGPDSGAGDAITAAMFHVTHFLEAAVRQETIISGCIVLIWAIIVLVGIATAIFLMIKGGDDGVYRGSDPTKPSDGVVEKHELRDLSRVPTYEQAINNTFLGPPVIERRVPGDHGANKYNGQTYTLTPTPGPTFDPHSATSPIMHTGFSPHPPNEKFGTVNGRYVDAAIRRQTHVRASSYGDYDITSPNSAHPQNPFSNPNYVQSVDEKRDPFADPAR